ncbi:MAG: hypothetical protein ACW981_18115 [Candidatus Hodarchaeales archaeon]|jgi:macrodomain Ter protein organizer (MatP/YcbG family)
MENSTLSTLLSVFDFRSGPKPVFCFPQDMGIEKTTKISFKGHLILSKSLESGLQSVGLFLPFNEYDLIGFVSMFKIQTDFSYTQESTYCLLSFLAPKENTLSCFSLISYFLSIASEISSKITSSIRYKGENGDFFEIEELLKKEQENLDNKFKERIGVIHRNIDSDKEIKKKLSNFLSKSKNDLDKLLYGLLIDFKQKMLIYTPKEDFGETIIDSMQLLTPHRILNIEFAGKGELKEDPEIIVCTDSDFFDLQAEFFDISGNYKSGKIITKDIMDRNKFVTEIADFLLKNKDDPSLIYQFIKNEMNRLLDLYLDFILAAGALTDEERKAERQKIIETNDKDFIKVAFTLATHFNPFLSEIDLM